MLRPLFQFLSILLAATSDDAASPPASPAHLVRDINTVVSSDFYGMTAPIRVGSTLVFWERTQGGLRLWRTDETSAGTAPLKDILISSSYDFPFLVPLGNDLYFEASDEAHGTELWRTDGSPGGTVLVKDISPGSSSSDPSSLTIFRGHLYFFAQDPIGGRRLWTSDGTAEGTVPVTSIRGGQTGYVQVREMAVVRGDLFVLGLSGDRDRPFGLWRTDGTDRGTSLVRELTGFQFSVCTLGGCPPLPPWGLVEVAGAGYFVAFDEQSSVQIWRTDGTREGTLPIIPLSPLSNFPYPIAGDGQEALTSIQGRLYFFADDGIHGNEPWSSDGTMVGTHLLKDIFPGRVSSSSGNHFVALGEAVFFVAESPSGIALWRTDGSPAGTRSVSGSVGECGGSLLASFGGYLYFCGGDSLHGEELWKTDGTPEGTSLAVDISPGPPSSHPVPFVVSGDSLYLVTFLSGRSLWRSDGSLAGTRPIAEIDGDISSSHPSLMTDVAGTLFFFAKETGVDGMKLFRSDATSEGTKRIESPNLPTLFDPFRPVPLTVAGFEGSFFFSGRDTRPPNPDDPRSGAPGLWKVDGVSNQVTRLADFAVGSFVPLPNRLVFDSVSSGALWSTDGTGEGTSLFWDPGRYSPIHGRTAFQGRLFFSVGGLNPGIWSSDGTVAGTALLEKGLSAETFLQVRRTLFFVGGFHEPFSLWKTDGTEGGTVLVKDVPVTQLLRADGTLFFLVADSSSSSLWSSDGTEGGTVFLQRIADSSKGEAVMDLTAVGSTLYFLKSEISPFTQDRVATLWRSDGTASGTLPIRVLASASGSLTAVGSTLFFVTDDPVSGAELWKSDGTFQGTRMVKDIYPGASGSHPHALAAVGDVILFAANDGEHGAELWRSDGTTEGTFLLQDIAPGVFSSDPADFRQSGRWVYFTADDRQHGRELWALPISALEPSRSSVPSPRSVPFH